MNFAHILHRCSTSRPTRRQEHSLRQPAGPDGDQFAARRPGHLRRLYSQKRDEAVKFLEWFIRTRRRSAGPSSAATYLRPVLKSKEFQNATPYNKAFTRPCSGVQGLHGPCLQIWNTQQLNQRIYPTSAGGEGEPKCWTLAADWKNRQRNTAAANGNLSRGGVRMPPPSFRGRSEQGLGDAMILP